MPEDAGASGRDEDLRAALADERRRIRYLRTIVDLTTNMLVQGRMTRTEAEDLVAAARQRTLELFPDKEQTYELILAPRFARLMNEFVGPATAPAVGTGKVLPFRRPTGS